MTLRGRGPWLASAALHLAVLSLGLVLLREPPAQTVLRMHFLSGSGAPAVKQASTAFSAPRASSRPPGEPSLPAWHGLAPSTVGTTTAPAPVSIEELLGPTVVVAEEVAVSQTAGWSNANGVGYAPPPLPPPGLSPPQGARWNLLLTIPAGGGFARAVEGLDSGHPDLDRWLEEYLRTVSFPSSPDDQDYQTRWVLRLESGRPR